jgi:hypothetical protein
MNRILFTLSLICFIGASVSMNAQQKIQKVMVAKHVDAAKKAKNPNIKAEMPATDVEAKKPEINRGSCTVSFSNSTGYYVKIYVDGNYKGTLAPYESGTVTVTSGYTTVYCITTGGTYDWSAQGSCDGSYSFDIR